MFTDSDIKATPSGEVDPHHESPESEFEPDVAPKACVDPYDDAFCSSEYEPVSAVKTVDTTDHVDSHLPDCSV